MIVCRSLAAASTFAVALLLAPVVRAEAEPAAVASTAAIDLSIEPPIPTAATPLLGAEEKPILVDGKATATSYQLFSFKPPAGRMFELRLFAPEGHVAMTIQRGSSSTPVSGARPEDRTSMWMSSAEAGEEIRILVRALIPGEVAFKLGAKLYPAEAGNN